MGHRFTRREFLAATTALAVTPGARASGESPNDRIGVGVIGVGDQGTNHLRHLMRNPGVEVRAVCDVYRPRLETARAISRADTYRDHGELLARDDIDCVWIATPDHWHARMGIDALEAGKDVYCEKPMGRYWDEARDFYRTAERTRRVVQIGAQVTSHPKYAAAAELVRDGRLGRLVLSQASFMRNSREGDWNRPVDYDARPPDLDWERFLGPAPKRPLDPERYFRWRKYWDYSGGIATDFLSHTVHPIAKATLAEWPVRAVAAGGILLHPDRQVPDTFHFLIDYASGHSLLATGAQTTGQGLPEIVRGHRGWLEMGRNSLTLWPDRLFTGEVEEARLRFEPTGDLLVVHHRNFLDCVRARDRDTNCPPRLGYRVALALDMANRSWRDDAVQRFDPERERLSTA